MIKVSPANANGVSNYNIARVMVCINGDDPIDLYLNGVE